MLGPDISASSRTCWLIDDVYKRTETLYGIDLGVL
jgi:hypothetical protein